MQIDWKNVLEQTLATVGGGLVLAILGYLWGLLTGKWKSLRAYFRALWKLIIDLFRLLTKNWPLTLGVLLLIGSAYGAFILTRSSLFVLLILSIAISIILLSGYWRSSFKRPSKECKFRTIPLPVGRVANANPKARYLNPPESESELDGVKFYIGSHIFDSENVKIIESDGRTKTKLELDEPAEHVKSIHLLINASGGWRVHSESGKVFEWMKIGRIRLIFADGSFEDTELILGDNIREWAIGNFPGELVGRVADPLCRVAWKGETVSGEFAVIDRLEIPLQGSNRKKQLESITFVRDIRDGAEASEGGLLHFLVSAVTLEFE